jgi:hypothetical protein
MFFLDVNILPVGPGYVGSFTILGAVYCAKGLLGELMLWGVLKLKAPFGFDDRRC